MRYNYKNNVTKPDKEGLYRLELMFDIISRI